MRNAQTHVLIKTRIVPVRNAELLRNNKDAVSFLDAERQVSYKRAALRNTSTYSSFEKSYGTNSCEEIFENHILAMGDNRFTPRI